MWTKKFQIYKLGLTKSRDTRDQTVNIHWIIEAARKFQGKKKTKLLLLPYDKAFDCGQFSSVTQSRKTLWNPADCSKPVLPVHHQLPEFTQTHVLWVGDAIPPSHPLSSPSPALSLPQHQGLFKWVSSSHQLTKVLESQFQHQSFQWIFRTDFL